MLHPSSKESSPEKGRKTCFLPRLRYLRPSYYKRERDCAFMDCNSLVESDRPLKGEPNPEVFWTVSGKSAVHKETELCSLTPSTSARFTAALQVWLLLGQQHGKSRQSPKSGDTASRAIHRLLRLKGKPSLGLLEGLFWAGKSLFITPASFRKTQESSFRAINC